MKQEIAQKNNEIERIKLIKVTDDETGKVSYEVLNRDKIHMEEEVFKYKRVDFAVKRYLHISCEYTPVNDLVEMCRNCVQETKAVSTCPVCGGAVEDEEMAAHLISQHSVPSGNAEDYEEYLIGRNGQIGISGKTVEMYEDEIEKMRAILSAAYGGPKEEQNEDEHEEEGDETNMENKTIIKNGIEFERLDDRNYAIRKVNGNFVDDCGDEYYAHVRHDGEQWVSSAVYDEETNPEDMPEYIEMCKEIEEGDETNMTFYKSMYDYVQDADLSYYEIADGKLRETPFVEEIEPTFDPDFLIFSNTVEHEGKWYRKVNFGENDESWLLDSALYETVFLVYTEEGEGHYVTDGRVYETEEAAKASI